MPTQCLRGKKKEKLMKTLKQKLGSIGEDMAVEYLREKGYKIIIRNFWHNGHELDIVCMDKNELVIVEVKSVRKPEYGPGEGRISKKKQRSMIKAGYGFLQRRPRYEGLDVRFDIISIKLHKYPAEIRHYQAAFWESW
jgi:putative endonuclease